MRDWIKGTKYDFSNSSYLHFSAPVGYNHTSLRLYPHRDPTQYNWMMSSPFHEPEYQLLCVVTKGLK